MKYDFTLLRTARTLDDLEKFMEQFGTGRYSHGMLHMPAADFEYVAGMVDYYAHANHKGAYNKEGWRVCYYVLEDDKIVQVNFMHSFSDFEKGSISGEGQMVISTSVFRFGEIHFRTMEITQYPGSDFYPTTQKWLEELFNYHQEHNKFK